MTTPDDELSRYNIEIKRELEGRTELAKRVIKERDQLRTKLTEAEALIERLVKFVADAANTVPEPDTEHWTLQAQASDIIKSKAVAEWRKGKG